MDDILKIENEFGENILNWYQFKNTDEILEIGESRLRKMLSEKCGKVVSINNDLENTEIDGKFDYIIMIGIIKDIAKIFGRPIKLKDLIVFLEKYLKDNGKFLIAVDNKFGLRYFAGNPDNILNSKFKSLIGYSDEKEKIETFTKKTLKQKLESIGYNTNFYYPLPDYKLPNVIFSEEYLPKYNNIDKYMTYYKENSTPIFSELDVFREILKDNEENFEFFANSFLVEASKIKNPIKYKYISFNNLRKDKYRLITKIADGYVEKQAVNNKSLDHYNQIIKNIEILKSDNIKVLDSLNDGCLQSKYVDQKYMLNNVITEFLEKKEYDCVDKIVNRYIEILSKDSYIEEEYEKTVFNKYNVQIEDADILKQLHFKKNGLWDMTFKNCFFVDDDFYFFDQEWNEEVLPVEYILYRSIVYTISLRRYVNIEDWLVKYKLDKFVNIFKELDDKMQLEIRDENIWNFFSQNKYINLDETVQEMKNMEMRSKSQQEAYNNLKLEYDSFRKKIESSIPYKFYKKTKKIIKRK